MSRTAMLTLDGEPIVMKSMRISVSMQFQDKDSSGQTSSTSSSEQGEKAKELDISGLVPFKDEQTLSRLFELADAKGDGGKRHIYRVGSLLAKSVKVPRPSLPGASPPANRRGCWRGKCSSPCANTTRYRRSGNSGCPRHRRQ